MSRPWIRSRETYGDNTYREADPWLVFIYELGCFFLIKLWEKIQ